MTCNRAGGHTRGMTRYANNRIGVASVTTVYPSLAPALEYLGVQQDLHFDYVKRLCSTSGVGQPTPLFDIDLVLLSVLNRSLDLIDGFLATYDRWNLSTAAPQVRMQIDNVLRLSLVRVAPPGTVTRLLLSGERLSTQVDPLAPSGKKHKLTDANLRDHARDLFPWLDRVYEKSSGWVHFSSTHVGVTIHVDDEGTVSARFPSDTARYPYEFLEQVLWAMNEATAAILELVEYFASGKEHAVALSDS
jgi:hypothetical protein